MRYKDSEVLLHVALYVGNHTYYLKRHSSFFCSDDGGKKQSFLIWDFVEAVPCFCQFPPKTPVRWLTRYLCNDRHTVLECFWVGRTHRIHRAAYSVKPEGLDSCLRSALGVINASSHYRENCSLIFILFSVYTYKYFEDLTSFTAQWLASVFCYCIVTVKICLLND